MIRTGADVDRRTRSAGESDVATATEDIDAEVIRGTGEVIGADRCEHEQEVPRT
jgi:hypothetical protein